MTAKIIQLEWNKDSDSYYWSECPIGNFVIAAGIEKDEGSFYSLFGVTADENDLNGIGTYKSVDEAKTTCQNHFENIVRKCLKN